eukprot:11589346-Heterocapsa_arctica.AAC.1
MADDERREETRHREWLTTSARMDDYAHNSGHAPGTTPPGHNSSGTPERHEPRAQPGTTERDGPPEGDDNT